MLLRFLVAEKTSYTTTCYVKKKLLLREHQLRFTEHHFVIVSQCMTETQLKYCDL